MTNVMKMMIDDVDNDEDEDNVCDGRKVSKDQSCSMTCNSDAGNSDDNDVNTIDALDDDNNIP